MNYYERHIGDYLKDTAHLSLLEHGIYSRLLDVYYTREEPIPAADAARLIGARTKEERDALEAVLREFFVPDDPDHPTGWLQDRCEREIARFKDKQKKAKRSADARWNAKRSDSERNANAYATASPNAMRTHSEGNAPRARPQTPDTRHQTPEGAAAEPPRAPAPTREEPPEVGVHQPTAAGLACRAMRAAGLADVNPGHPTLLRLLEQGATVDELSGHAAEAVSKGKGFAWVLATVEGRRRDAATVALAPKAPPPSPTVASDAAERTQGYLAEQERRAAEAQSPEAQAARKAAMAKLRSVGRSA